MMDQDELKENLEKILVIVAQKENIQNYEVHPNIDADFADGFVSHFFTGEVRNKNTGGVINVAIKKAPINDWNYGGVFKNEYVFYSKIFQALDSLQREVNVSKPFDNIPKYFCSGMEPKKEFVALENLKPAGYVMFDKKQYFDDEHLEFIFKLYGKFHACSYVLRNKNPEIYQKVIEQCTNVMTMLGKYGGNQMAAAVREFLNSVDLKENNGICEAGLYLAEHVRDIFLQASEYQGDLKCVTHGDCWSNNMVFKYAESGKLLDVKLLDFQICRESSPIHDLSYFFYSGASKRDFDNLEYYLQIYYETFSDFSDELGIDPNKLFSFEVLVKEWKENALLGVLLGIWLWQLKLVPKEEFKEFMNKHEGVGFEGQIRLWDDFLKNVTMSELYKEKIKPILIHAYDFGILRIEKFKINN